MIFLLFRALALILMLSITAGNAFAFDWKDLWQRPDQRAYQILQDGDSVTAAEIFDDPQWRGVSHYRAGEFEQAQKEFNSVEGDTALYNQGVTAVQQGDFDAAIEKFENLLERSPDHLDGQHNLEIARELAKQQEQEQEQEQQQGDQSEQQEGSDQQSDSKEQQDQSNAEGEGQSQDAESGSEGEQSDSESSDEQRGGELTAEPEDAAAGKGSESEEDSQSGQQNQEQQSAEQQSQQGALEQQEGDEGEESQSAAVSPSGPSESEQATEQWLRRIPDDPSQLLRNKIKLNHMIEHADVRDMQEPW